MAAPGLGHYVHAAPDVGLDSYGVQLQAYPPPTGASSSSTSSPFLPALPPTVGGFHLDQHQQHQQLDWGAMQQGQPHLQLPPVTHGGWMGALPPGLGDLPGDVGGAGGVPAPEGGPASTVAYPPSMNAHGGMHSLPPVQYDWQLRPRPYTPYHLPSAAPPPPPAQGGSLYAYRHEYSPYAPPHQLPPPPPAASHAPLTYQPLLPTLAPHRHAQPPLEQAPPVYHHSSPAPLPSLPLSYPSVSSYPRRDSLSTTNATRDGSAAVSTPSSPGSAAPEEPPALVEPHSPGTRLNNHAASAIELPAHRSVPPLIPALGHINSADVGRARVIEADPGAAAGTKRVAAAPEGKVGAPPTKRKKEPKDLASRKYACNECDQRFARPSALATHVVRCRSPLVRWGRSEADKFLTDSSRTPRRSVRLRPRADLRRITCADPPSSSSLPPFLDSLRLLHLQPRFRRHVQPPPSLPSSRASRLFPSWLRSPRLTRLPRQSHALAPEQESSARPRPALGSSSSGSSGSASGSAAPGFLPDPGPPPLRPLAPAPPGLLPAAQS